MSIPTNVTLGVSQTIKDAITNGAHKYLKEALLKWIISKVPFLGWSWVNPILVFVITKIIDKALEIMGEWLDFAAIDFDLYQKDVAYRSARDNLRTALNPPPSERDPNEIERLRKEMEDRAFALIRLRPTVK